MNQQFRKPEVILCLARKGSVDGPMVHVKDVENGLASGCFCDECGEAVASVQGVIKEWHFRHYEVSRSCDPKTAAETALHAALKQVLMEGNCLYVPALFSEQSATYNFVTRTAKKSLKGNRFFYKNPREEVFLPGMRPDIIVEINGRDFIVEIAVTHRADRRKRDVIRKRGLPAIEIRAHKLSREAGLSELKEFVEQSYKSRYWLYSPRKQSLDDRVRAEAEATAKRAYGEMITERRLVKAARAAAAKAPMVVPDEADKLPQSEQLARPVVLKESWLAWIANGLRTLFAPGGR